MPVVGNRIKVASSSTGTGNITLGSAEDGFQTFADGGISNNDVVRYVITEGSSFEIGKGTYLTSGPTLTRTSGNLLESSTGSLLNLSGSATVFVSLADTDVMQTDGGTFSGDVTFTGDSYNALWDKSQDALHFNDRATLSFGGGSTAPDMWIEHNNALNLNRIRGSDITIQDYDGSNIAVFQEDAGAALYHNGSLKAEIVSTGLDISSGDIRFGGSADEKVGSSSSRTFLTGNLGSQLRAGNNTKVAATTTGVELTGATIQDGDFTFTGASYNAVWDKSDNALEFADNAKASFGTGGDLQLFHNGNSNISNFTGNLTIANYADDKDVIIATDTGSGFGASYYFVADGSTGEVRLYHYGTEKLSTKSYGGFLSGGTWYLGNNSGLNTFKVSERLDIKHDGHTGHGTILNTQGNLTLINSSDNYDISIQTDNGSGSYTDYFKADGSSGEALLYYYGSEKLATKSTGIQTTGTVNVNGAYTLPTSDGSANQVLTTDGSGAVTFADAGGGADLYAANPVSATDPSAGGNNSIAIGSAAVTTNANSIAIGTSADADSGGLAIGKSTHANSGAVAIGGYTYGADASGAGSIAIGGWVEDAVASSSYSIAIGEGTDSTSARSTAIGNDAQAVTGTRALALQNSRAAGASSTAINIDNNTSSYGATGANSIAMGLQAKATASEAFTVGGYAQGTRSIAIGASSHATSTYGCAVGYDTTAVGSALALGTQANAQQGYSVAIHRGKSEQRGKIAFSGGIFATQGDAQGGQFVLLADTTDATATVLTSNNGSASSTNQIVAASDTCITFDGTITAMQNGAQAYASWRIEGLLVNDGGTTTLANSATTVISNLSSWGMALSADNTNNALAITCTGEAAHNIRWVANIRTTEVTYA